MVLMNDTFRCDHVNAHGLSAPWELPVGGSQFVQTPAPDQLASEPLLFDNLYAGSYPTIPTHYDLWTGRFGRGLDVSENVTWADYGADHDVWAGPDTLREPISISDANWQLILSAEGHVSELYDIHADPAQTDNVLDENPAVAGRLHRQIIAFFEARDAASARIAAFGQYHWPEDLRPRGG